jgi:adenine-specific DNA-methyltransferase
VQSIPTTGNTLTQQMFTTGKTAVLFPDLVDFSSPYFKEQLITYIGNKRSLLPFINEGVEYVKTRLNKKKLSCLDGFAGSGSVARLLKHHAHRLVVNDLEKYSETINKCYLTNRSGVDLVRLSETISYLNSKKQAGTKKLGFIETNYAPKNDNSIKAGERVFYTNTNAKIIDNLINLIDKEVEPKMRLFCLAPLIVAASVHTNTSGVFKGFHKKNGIGHFGGAGENALFRIKGEITLKMPIFCDIECTVDVYRKDINQLAEDSTLGEFDLVYLDPPYNQHPYGSNYFMLNIIAGDKAATDIQDGVSGISTNWNRSAYNKRQQAEEAMERLVETLNAKFILISYNDEGIIPINAFKSILSKHGNVQLKMKDYNTYRGSRNLNGRNIKVKELLWILEKR